MVNILYCLAGLALVVFILWFTLSTIKFVLKYKQEQKELEKPRFRDDRAEFMADLSKLSYKWEARGCTDFSRASRLIINAWYVSQDKDYPQTAYGKQVYESLKSLEQEELNEQ